MDALGEWMLEVLTSFFSSHFGSLAVDDMVQTTAIDLLTKLELAPSDPAGFVGWMRSFAVIQVRRVMTERKREYKRALELDKHLRAQEPNRALELEFGDEELAQAVRALLDEKLPAHYREVLLARVAEYSYATIARQLGIPVSTARSCMRLAQRRVRAAWDQERLTAREFRTHKTGS